jgi:hypothetical protein
VDNTNKNLSAIKGGKSIIGLTFNFVLDTWNICNEKEHDTLGNPLLRKIEKICEQILYIKEMLDEIQNHVWSELSKVELMSSPYDNLVMILAQMNSMLVKNQ